MSSDSKKRLALAIIDFLSTSTKDGTVSSDDKESIEVAQQCIADAFKVDPTDKTAMMDALAGQSLQSIYGVFEKMKQKNTPAKPASPPIKPATPTTPSGPSDAEKAEAESLKGKGNAAMAKKDYPSAIEYYTQALRIVPNNPIYLSNRAAAYSSTTQYEKAILDAQVAVDTDPSYAKAWSRLGHARFAKGDARGAMEAYKAGIEAEGNGGSQITRNGYETAKKKVEEEIAAEADNITPPSGPSTSRGAGGAGGAGGMPDLSSLAGMLGGAGAPLGGGGMPDLSSIMNNPMFAQMAQNLMSNPALMQNMMNNPLLREMLDSVGGDDGEGPGAGGGGRSMPDLSGLLADPNIAEMAKNLMGPGGGPGGAGGAGGDAGDAAGSGHT
ncbi:hypothetical protein B9Z19DRAFT_1079579 [Tuber borchii]|uniref:SGTA homodimerisation domain-containing protein n=1 Tax=Tuber borchii TaxID=42251 RepID=A0A2T6ZXY2_TUBBO|nr:hypothetical protein B9Z19DRAFT_1079579 [Tuber borchii]